MSLAKAIDGLYDPSPVFEEDDDHFDDGTAATNCISYDDEDVELKANVPRSKLRARNENIALTQGNYTGKVVKRKDLDSDQEEDEHDWSDEVSSEMEEDIFDGPSTSPKSRRHNKTRNYQEDDDDDEDDDDEEEEEEDENNDDSDQDEEIEAEANNVFSSSKNMDKTLKTLEDQNKFFSDQRKSIGQAEIAKAQHVKNQYLLWEDFLEMRILIQRIFLNANKLPPKDVLEELQKMDPTLEKKLDATSKDLQALVTSVHDIQRQVNERNSSLSKFHEKNVEQDGNQDGNQGTKDMKKRKHNVMWESMISCNKALHEYHEEVLNEWTKRANLYSTTHKKFKVINQSIHSQVDAIMSDTSRIQRRAHPQISSVQVIGVENSAPTQPNEVHCPENEDEPFPEQKTPHYEMLNELVYDDSEFYQYLMKEFIENSSGGTLADGIAKYAVTRKKSKKIVDTKASKGRKLRFTCHAKLKNFMFPNPYPEPFIDVNELFASLLGKKSNNNNTNYHNNHVDDS